MRALTADVVVGPIVVDVLVGLDEYGVLDTTGTVEVVGTLLTGPVGPRGADGTGSGGGTGYVHEQGMASADWAVQHGLGYLPAVVAIYDTAGTEYDGFAVEHNDVNNLVIHLGAPMSGTAPMS